MTIRWTVGSAMPKPDPEFEERRRLLLLVPCRLCKANPGQHCRTMGGARDVLTIACSHSTRYVDAGILRLRWRQQ